MIKTFKSIVKIIVILMLVRVFLLAIKSTPSEDTSNSYEVKTDKNFSKNSSDRINPIRKTTEKTTNENRSREVNLSIGEIDQTLNEINSETINLSKAEIDQTLNEINPESSNLSNAKIEKLKKVLNKINAEMVSFSNKEIDQTLNEINFVKTSNTDIDDSSLVKKGMHRVQVRKIKGPPISTKIKNNQVLWIYKDQYILFSKSTNKVTTIMTNN